MPGPRFFREGLKGFHPGCPECVHIHWRWSTNVATVQGLFPQLGDGTRPLIRKGSKQTVTIDIQGLLAGGLKYNSPVLYYVSESPDWWDEFFAYGGWFAPHFDLLTNESAKRIKGAAPGGIVRLGEMVEYAFQADATFNGKATFDTFYLKAGTVSKFELLAGDDRSILSSLGEYETAKLPRVDGYYRVKFSLPKKASAFAVKLLAGAKPWWADADDDITTVPEFRLLGTRDFR